MSEPTKLRLKPHHAGYRSWTTDWYDALGKRRTKRFGKEGEVTRGAARAKFRDWYDNEWSRKPHVRNPDGDGGGISIAQLAERFREFCKTVYVKRGEPTSHMNQVNAAMDVLTEALGQLPAASVEAPAVARLREQMVWTLDRHGARVALSMKTVNGRLHLIKQCFAWAREQGLIPAAVAYDVSLVKPLKRGRSEARDPVPVRPVEREHVAATCRFLPPLLRRMVWVQWLTGMRPGEVCELARRHIDMSGDVWQYTPPSHKCEHHDKQRVVSIGRRAQRLLRGCFKPDLDAPIFSPREAQQQRRDQRTAARATPASCGNTVGSNRLRRPKRAPGERYSEQSYRKAIRHALRAAKKAGVAIPKWCPNQIRHSWATRIRKQFGIEEASVGLGHSNLKVTEVYALRDLAKATEVARKVG